MYPRVHAATSPDKPALIMGASGEVVTYRELDERSCRLARLSWDAGEIENVLVMHPSVADVAVFGVPDDDFGEQVKAVVQPAPGTDAGGEAGAELERRLIAYCREHLAAAKCPKTIDFAAELPRLPTGKLYKRLLRDPYWEGREVRI